MDKDYILKLFPELDSITDETVKEGAARAWLLSLEESDWEKIEDMPWIPGVAEFITNVDHCRGTSRRRGTTANRWRSARLRRC